MKTMKVTDAIRIILDKDCDSSGSECQFFDLGDGTGVKLYNDKSRRDRSYTVQKYVHGVGLAPETGKKLQMTYEGCTYYGFFTEVVKPLPGYGVDNHGPDEVRYLEGYDDKELREIQDSVDCTLEEFQEKTGFSYMDDHTNNFGFDSKGDLKIIDFDVCFSLHRHIS